MYECVYCLYSILCICVYCLYASLYKYFVYCLYATLFICVYCPDDKIFTNWDYDNYAEIMHSTNALRRNNDESETKPKANRRWKLKHILKPIWDENISIQEKV